MPEPRWLSPVEQRAWRSWIDSSRRIAAAVERQLRTDHGLTLDDYEVLVRLSESPDHRLRMTDLAASVTNSPSRLSQRIDRLSERGWVRRVADDDDRRVSHACLTPDGHAFLAAIAPSHVEEVRRQMIDRLTSEQVAALAEVLPALLDDEQRVD